MLKITKLALASLLCLNAPIVAQAGSDECCLPSCIDYSVLGGFDDFLDSGCTDGCCDCGPEWEFSASLLYLTRSDTGDHTLVTDANGPVVSGSDFDFDYSTGYELSGKRTWCDNFISTRFFAIDSLTARDSTLIAGGGGVFNTTPVTPFGADDVDSVYGSNLYSMEVNFGRVIAPESEVFVGVRTMQLSETMNLGFSTPDVFIVNSDVDNYLYGLQAGGNSTFFQTGRFSVEGAGAAGLYWNNASSTVLAAQPPTGATFGGTAGDSEDMVTFSLEAALKGKYQINRSVSLFAGYQLQFLSGVALAPDQLGRTGNLAVLPTAPVATTVDSSSLFYHGFNFGLEATF